MRKEAGSYLFKFFLFANLCQYLEAGAVPAMLLILSKDFGFGHGQEGLLGGVVYLAISFGGPFAGYLLHRYDQKTVIGTALILNSLFTLLWAMTPVRYSFSKALFIGLRFLMGVAQCSLCVFLPLWINEFSPSHRRTSWMGYLQASAPLGVMMGYILASTIMISSRGSETCGDLNCWRWAFLFEVILLLPICIAFQFIPREHLNLELHHRLHRTPQNNEVPLEHHDVALDTPKQQSLSLLIDVNGSAPVRIRGGVTPADKQEQVHLSVALYLPPADASLFCALSASFCPLL